LEYHHGMDFLVGLPKAELHLHLEGTIKPSTLVKLSERHDAEPITLAEAEALYTYQNFEHFLSVWTIACQRLQTPEDYATIAYDMFESLAQQGVKHAEVYVAVGGLVATRPHVNVVDVFSAIEVARIECEARFGISALWIVDATRQRGAEHVGHVFDIAAKLRERFPAVVGVGIGGDEVRGPCGLFKDVFRKARQNGLKLTAHCGEATGQVDGPLETWDAIDMGVERLGHALGAQYDDDLLEELKRMGTVLELNVTSNLRTGVCKSLHCHPIKKYVELGLKCTINSDDPAMFGSNLLQEYVLVHGELGFSMEDMRNFALNSFRCSFLNDKRIAYLVSMVDEYKPLLLY
jgi:aminodeoxyfutalosine deaminase